MAEQYVPNLGHTPDGQAKRDAVHVAVAPVEAGEDLSPGQDVCLREGLAFGWIERAKDTVGIVDPFLRSGWGPRKGQRFWLFLYPGTVTSLRHVWTRPAFRPAVPKDWSPNVDG